MLGNSAAWEYSANAPESSKPRASPRPRPFMPEAGRGSRGRVWQLFNLHSRALTLHDELRGGQHGGLAAVLPAAAGAAHATLARRPLLRPRAADVDDLAGVCRPFVLRPVGAVSGL